MSVPVKRAARIAALALLSCSAAAAGPGAAWSRPASAAGSPTGATAVVAGPGPPALAYVTGTALSPPVVWVADVRGAGARRLGSGSQPLIAPDGGTVAASLSGAVPGSETGPALALYATSGGSPRTYLSGAAGTALPLAWSPDSRYLAAALFSNNVHNAAGASLVLVIDTATGAITTVAHGQAQGASFAVDGTDRLVFGLTRSEALAAPVNLYVSSPGGSGATRITRDGRSLDPLWGPLGIVFDRERIRRLAPEYQIWLLPVRGSSPRRITHIHVPSLLVGLVPVAFSADGSRLLAELEGQDTSEAWTVAIGARRARPLRVAGRQLIGAGISHDGSTVLVDEGAQDIPPSAARVATVPFGGGSAHVLVAHGSQASWSGVTAKPIL